VIAIELSVERKRKTTYSTYYVYVEYGVASRKKCHEARQRQGRKEALVPVIKDIMKYTEVSERRKDFQSTMMPFGTHCHTIHL
jgi:hypothetical protein